MTSTLTSKRHWIPWFLLTAGVALLERILLWLYYPPVTYHDTGGYRRLADTILGGWKFYDGTRSPGYPQWMAWIGSDTQVYLSQLVMGMAITLAIFFLGWQAARSPAFGAGAALAHTLNLNQLLFEANLLSETLATFCLIMVLVSVSLALRRQNGLRWLGWLGAGLFATFAGIVRPLYLFVPFWAAVFLAFARPGPDRDSEKEPAIIVDEAAQASSRESHLFKKPGRVYFDWRPLVVASLPAIVIIGAYVNFLFQRYGVLSVTTMGGYHLVQHTGQWFELLPDENAGLRDVFLKYRADRIAKYGTPGNTIWDALPEMQQVSGLGFFQLSQYLQNLSIQLILQHPDRYLLSALDGWQLYWRAPVYWEPQQVSPAWLQSGLETLVSLERYALFAANLIFLVSSVLVLASRRWRARLGVTPWWAFVLLTSWLASIIQTLPDHGDNPRFLVPMQSWIVLWVIWLAWRLWATRKPVKNIG